jgi:hypothetical protein
MTDREVMQMALKALESRLAFSTHSPVLQNLRAALEQPKGLFIDMIAAHGPEFVEQVRRVGENIEQLEQQAEPVAWVFAPNNELLWPSEVEVTNPIEIDSYQPLYTTPPQRKPLTGEQIEFSWMKAMQSTPGTTLPIHEFARAIEQAHDIKEKSHE